MEDQASLNLIAAHERRWSLMLRFVRTRTLGWGLLFRFSAREAIPSARQFLDSTAFFQLGEHPEQGAGVGLLEMKALGNFAGRGGLAPNLQKTQYVIRAQVGRARHAVLRRGTGASFPP